LPFYLVKGNGPGKVYDIYELPVLLLHVCAKILNILRGKNLRSENLGWFPLNYTKDIGETTRLPKNPETFEDSTEILEEQTVIENDETGLFDHFLK